MTIRGVRWRKEIPWRLITLPPFHLAASRTQQFAYRSPRHRYIRIRPSLPLKWKLDSSVNRISIHCLCNHRWRRWIHYSRFYRLINVKSLPWNVRQQCKPIGRSRRRTIDADIRRPTTSCKIYPNCAAVRNRSRRWHNWMRQFWFGEVTQLSGRGLSFTEPVSAILWANQGEQPICLEKLGSG